MSVDQLTRYAPEPSNSDAPDQFVFERLVKN